MSFMIILVSLALLMIVAYRGFSVILFAPICALIAVAFTDVSLIPPLFNGIFMEKLVGFVKLYFPVFLLGAVFGKLIELSGFSKSIVASVIKIVGRERAILSIVLVCAILTYGGVSLFVVVFAVYPFAAETFRQSDIPKRLIPGTIALGAFTFTMDSLPGSPQIQNIIPTTFFNTNTWAAPWLGVIGAVFILVIGLMYLNWRRLQAAVAGEGYGSGHINEPTEYKAEKLPNAFVALFPLLVVGVMNKILTELIPRYYGEIHSTTLSGSAKPLVTDIHKIGAIWAVEGALLLGILCILLFAFKTVKNQFADGSKAAVSGALLASLNTASEYGFGGIIAAMPGFAVISDALKAIPNPLINESITVTVLAGITGSASGGMSIALAAMSETFIKAANAAHIPMEVLHRVASMASGGMDTLPHNGAVITLLAVTGLTHKTSYKDIFAVTLIKTAAVFVVIAVYYLTGIY
ncbi:GntP family permease [Undibacterium sp. Dicai25W]|uniref:GntP family permease n=1 Tax=Undibacterium sp. Dicai25W TaxID=3413034 RepID=UPI003BF20C90